jgi:hypothetical protein
VSNPANYVGWNTNIQDNLLRYNNGADLSLLTNAQKSLRVTRSYAGTWQGFLWDGAVVPPSGGATTRSKARAWGATPVTSNRQILNIQPDVYRLPDAFPANQTFKDHSTAGGVVVHLNKLMGSRDRLPLNVSLSVQQVEQLPGDRHAARLLWHARSAIPPAARRTTAS